MAPGRSATNQIPMKYIHIFLIIFAFFFGVAVGGFLEDSIDRYDLFQSDLAHRLNYVVELSGDITTLLNQ